MFVETESKALIILQDGCASIHTTQYNQGMCAWTFYTHET